MHHWTEEDDLIGYYLYRFGDKKLSVTKEELADTLGMGWASMAFKIANFKSLDGKGGMANATPKSRTVYDRYKNMPDSEFEIIGMETVISILARKHKELEARLAALKKT